MFFPLYDNNPHYRVPWITLLIIVVNVGAMFWTASLPSAQQVDTVYRFGFVPKRVQQLQQQKPLTIEVPTDEEIAEMEPAERPVQQQKITLAPRAAEVGLSVLTMMFLHANLIHLALNMWMLWVFGNNIEDRLGHFIFTFFYLLGGAAATACHWAHDPASEMPVIGASGAVGAVLGAYAVTFPAAKVKTLVFLLFVFIVDLPALVVLGVWFAIQLANGLDLWGGGMNQPIAFWAHIGGFVAGIVLMPLLSLGAPPADSDWRKEADELFGMTEQRKSGDPRQEKPQQQAE